MPRATRFSIRLVLAAVLTGLAAQSIPVAPAQSPTKSKSRTSVEVPPEAHPDQLQAMQADAKKMRVILNQMRTNLAFVQNTQTPLKHQFELEVDMWQTLLDQMDRRIQEMEHSTGTKPAQ